MPYKKRILIVDDNHAIHEDIKHILSAVSLESKDTETIALEEELFNEENPIYNPSSEFDVQYSIDDAYQGEEALMMVEEAEKEGNPYALIFMDVRMPPGIDGIQAIHELWKKYPHIEVVICTAYSDYSWDKIVEKLGTTSNLMFMKKPFEATTVKQTALSLTEKWDLERKNKAHIDTLKEEISKRTKQLENMVSSLTEMKEQAVALTIAKSSFVSNMSFDIRTPLSGIMGMTDMLLETDLSAEQRNFAKKIKVSSDSLLTVINDILDFTKIETENIKLEIIEFNIRTMVEDVADIVSVIAHEKGLELATIVHSDVPETLVGDPMRLRQVILNFASNAVKFTESGEIVLSVCNETAKNPGNQNQNFVTLRFEVADTGIGLSDEEQVNLFEPYTQAGTDTSRKYGGTGLGLSISRQLAELMNGNIGVKSEKNKGSTFWLTAEFESIESIDYQFEMTCRTITGIRCMIISNNTSISKILSLYINHWGGKCSETNTKDRAIEQLYTALETRPFDIAIVDYMDGAIEKYIDIAKDIKSNKQLENTHLICITSKAKRGDAQILKDNGYSAFLSKPLKQTHLFNSLLMIKDSRFINAPPDHPGIITKHFVDEFTSDRYRVLVVEDEPINQRVISGILTRLKIRCDIAENGQKAFEAFTHKKFDLILMDCYMPVIDGYEATEMIRKFEKGSSNHIPILALTADAFTENQNKCKDAGMDDFITKPCKTEKLCKMLKHYLK